LDSDRGAILTVKSAALGIIDYREADILDRGWWRKWRMLVGEVATKDNAELLRDLYTYHLALVANSGLSEDSFKSVQESARTNLEQLIAVKRPWEEAEKTDIISSEVSQFKEDFKRFFDIDLDDEEQKEKYYKELEQSITDQKERAHVEASSEDVQAHKIDEAAKRVKERRRRAHKS